MGIADIAAIALVVSLGTGKHLLVAALVGIAGVILFGVGCAHLLDRHEPGEEDCWSLPLAVDEHAAVCFVARGSRPHVLWLSLDLRAPHSMKAVYIVLASVQALAGGAVLGGATIATRAS